MFRLPGLRPDPRGVDLVIDGRYRDGKILREGPHQVGQRVALDGRAGLLYLAQQGFSSAQSELPKSTPFDVRHRHI